VAAIKTALVIGAGIAGPVAALALRKAGIDATVYEAYPAAADGTGGVLTLAPNGLAALDIIGAEEAVSAVGQPVPDMVFEDGRGKRMGVVAGLPGLPPSRVLWRADLARVLHDRAMDEGIRIEYGKRLTGAVPAAGGVLAQFADGSTASADVLIGTDGIRSVVRALIDQSAPAPEYVGLLGFGVPGTGVVDGVARGPGTMHFAFGKRAFFGYWTQPDGSTALFSNLPHANPMTLAEVRQTPATEWLRRLREAHSGDFPAQQILARASADQLLLAGPLEMMPPVPHWYRGRMVLVGDSVHAPSSSSGQGASLAIESAIELSHCLRDIPDVTAAFSAYELLRRDRVEKIAANAKKTSSNKASGPVAKKVMGFAAPLALRTFLTPEKMFGPVHRYRIDWSEQVSSGQLTSQR
jgi:2-polyprenyl-6-methoxyphenol hydroxylase-like FAD-dependent oxidoreductase